MTEMASPSCATAPSFWKWRDVKWPELAPAVDPHSEEPEWKELTVLASLCAVFGIAGFATDKLGFGPAWLHKAFYAVALIAGGWDAAIDSWANIRQRKLDIHFLMLAVAIGAVCGGAWVEAVLLLFLFSASGAMEEFAMDRTHREVNALLKSAPKVATLLWPTGGEREVPVEEIGIGDRLLVKPGEAFAADGTVDKGKSASDESALEFSRSEAARVAELRGKAVSRSEFEKVRADAGVPGAVCSCGTARVTLTRRPSSSAPSRADTAASRPEVEAKKTNPKPRERLVWRSRMTRAETAPNWSKTVLCFLEFFFFLKRTR